MVFKSESRPSCTRSTVCLICLLGPSFAPSVVTCQDGNACPKPQLLIDKIVHADNPGAVALGFQNLVEQFGSKQLRSLTTCENLSISLRAAWEEVLSSLPQKRQKEARTVDPGHLEWFLGFIEGRLYVPPPQWWKTGISLSRAFARDNVIFQDLEQSSLYHKTWRELEAPRDTSMVERDGEVRLVVGKASTTIPLKEFERIVPPESQLARLSACLAEKRCYIAVHDGMARAGSLFALDRHNGKPLWEKELWVGRDAGAYSGQDGLHCVSIVTHRDRIIVFGMGGNAAYVEGYGAEDGRPLFRFSTNR
jgi:hypothetical protein